MHRIHDDRDKQVQHSKCRYDDKRQERRPRHAGKTSITGRTMPIDQLSRVMIWNRLNIEAPTVPNHCGNVLPNRFVAMTAAM